jgi:alpha-methylacyl-CoA racemase
MMVSVIEEGTEEFNHMRTDESAANPLRALRVIEFEAIGPGPLAGHMLNELGAHVTVIARPSTSPVDRALIGENTDHPLSRLILRP